MGQGFPKQSTGRPLRAGGGWGDVPGPSTHGSSWVHTQEEWPWGDTPAPTWSREHPGAEAGEVQRAGWGEQRSRAELQAWRTEDRRRRREAPLFQRETCAHISDKNLLT